MIAPALQSARLLFGGMLNLSASPSLVPKQLGNRARSKSLASAGLYLVIATLWLVISDVIASRLSPVRQSEYHRLLIWPFLVGSAAMVAALVARAVSPVIRSEAALRATIESMVDAVVVVSQNRMVVDVNRAALKLFRARDKSEVLGSLEALASRLRLRRPDGQPISLEAFASVRALNRQTVPRYEALIDRGSLGDAVVSVAAAPVLADGGGDVPFAVTTLRDVTELKRLERLRDEFLSIAAHELKTPLAVVKGYSQVLERHSSDGSCPDTRPLVMRIDRQCNRMNRIVQDLLELSRVQMGRFLVRPQPCDLAALLADAVEGMRTLASNKVFVLHGEREAPACADRERLDQVVINLLDNAAKFSPEGGEVIVELRPDGEQWLVTVADHGPGIAPEDGEHVFDLYYQARRTVPGRGGLGIGLFISREIVRAHGGRIWFDSELDKGTAFHFTVPAAQGAACASPPAPSSAN